MKASRNIRLDVDEPQTLARTRQVAVGRDRESPKAPGQIERRPLRVHVERAPAPFSAPSASEMGSIAEPVN